MPVEQSQILDEATWDLLLQRVRQGKCTPFLGAGACAGTLPLGAEISKAWAQKYGYPLEDPLNLPRVAQYVALTTTDRLFPKDNVLSRLKLDEPSRQSRDFPDFTKDDEPHSVLARLPLSIYITTNYDDFLVKALEHHGKKPVREIYPWRADIKIRNSVFARDSEFEPNAQNPIVYHLHGHNDDCRSLVLTEDDYMDFLVHFSRQHLPAAIQRAITDSSLLFVGYQLADLSFRVLFRSMVTGMEKSLRRVSVTVQLPPLTEVSSYPDEVFLTNGDKISGDIKDDTDAYIEIDSPGIGTVHIEKNRVGNVVRIKNRADVQNYLDTYFDEMGIKTVWCNATEFMAELKRRWDEDLQGRSEVEK